MIEMVLASGNAGKLKEFQAIFSTEKLNIRPQSDFNIKSADEIGLSFIENALIKARHASSESGLPAIADDSGLVVPALNGEPGIYSARYSASSASDQSNIDYLLSNMKDINIRQAYFYCALVLMRHSQDPCPIIATGQFNGEIATNCSGQNGFGYDPIFYVPSQKMTAAELPSDIKNKLSHRGQACKILLNKLQETPLC